MTKNLLKLLKATEWYLKKGYPVIPCRGSTNKDDDKKANLSWKQYQNQLSDIEYVKTGLEQDRVEHPMIAVATGKFSKITVLDPDTKEALDSLNEMIPDSLEIPTVLTPRGKHLWFEYVPELHTGTNILPNLDIRNDGGYAMIPPSTNIHGKAYQWVEGLHINDVKPPPMPDFLKDTLIQAQNGGRNKQANASVQPGKINQGRIITFDEPGRDDSLFSLAHHLVKGGMPEENIRKYLYHFAATCNPPFDSKETEWKIKSALERNENALISLTEEYEQWMSEQDGEWRNNDMFFGILTNPTSDDKKKLRAIQSKFKKKGLIKATKWGTYKRVDAELHIMDFKNVNTDEVDLWLPFGINDLVKIMPGNIIVIAGEPNAGKTAFLLNTIKENMRKFEIHYFNSEMGEEELNIRLNNFEDITLDQWKFTPCERSGDFADVIQSGKGKINIIDYFEIHKDFYEIGGHLAEIHEKLKGAIAIVALQKNQNRDTGVGDFRGLEKPRLYLAMGGNKIKIVKGKIWRDGNNPNQKCKRISVIQGYKLREKSDWFLDI